MACSSTLLTDSSQDWSASYRFDSKKGVTSVYTLPGQAALADPSASLKGIDFRSGPRIGDAGPYHTEETQGGPLQHHAVRDYRPQHGDHLNHSASRSRGHMRESGKRRPRSPLKPEQYKGALAVNPEVFSHVNSWLLDISNRADASVSSQDKQRAGEQTLHSGESDAEVSRTPDESPILLIPEVTHHSPHPKVDGGAAYGSETTTESSKVSSSHMASILAHQKPVEAHKHGAASSVLNTLVDVPQSDTDSLVLDTTPIDLRPFLKVHSLPNQAVLPAAEDKTRRSMQESVSKSPVQLESITRASSGPSTLSSVPSHPVGPSVKHQKISPGKSSSQFSDSSGSKLGLLRDPYSILLGIAAVTPHRLQTGVQDKTTKVSDGSSDSPLHLPATLEAARHSKASTESITASSTSASSLDRSLHSSHGAEPAINRSPEERFARASAVSADTAGLSTERSSSVKSGVRDPPEATLSVPRPSILRNPSYVVLPLSSPVRKSVAFDEEIAVDIPQPQAFADQRPPQSDASSPRGTTLESDTKPSVTIPLADVSTDTSTSADSEDESVNTTTHSPPDMTARSQTSSRTRSYLESPARETTVKPETTPDKSPGKVVLTKEKDMQREGFVAQQSMLPHANSLPRPGRASRQSSRTSRRSRDEIKVTPSMPTRVPASKPFSDMREDSLVAEGTVLPNASVPEDRPPIKSSLPPEALAQPVIMENVLYDYVRKQNAAGWYYRSGVIMPLLPDVQVLSLSCERVTRSLHRCRDSTVYKRLRKLIWRFHLDLEDLNKIRQRQWVELAETCIALVNRMMEDLSQGHTFRDRWDRKRYAHILGDAHGRDPNTIFFMFGASIPFMHLGARYCQEAKSVLQMIAAQASEQLQATLTGDPVAAAMVQRYEQLASSLDYIENYFATLANCTGRVRDVMLVAMTRIAVVEVKELTSKADDPDDLTPEKVHADAYRRSDLTAWLDMFLGQCLRQWSSLMSKANFEDSLKKLRNYDRVWEEEGPNFGLLRSMFCLGIFLPRDQRTKLVGWHFVDRELAPRRFDRAVSPNNLEEKPEIRTKPETNKKWATILSKTRFKSRAFLMSILEKMFASWEDEDDLESLQGERDEPGQTVNGALQTSQPTQSLDNVEESVQVRESSSDERPSTLPVEHTDESNRELLVTAMDLIGNIGSNRYRDALLYQTEQRTSLWATNASLPSAQELERLFPLPPEPTAKHSIYHLEWKCLRAFVDLLDNEVSTSLQLWQIYLLALESFGLHTVHRKAQMVYKSLYERESIV